jgi:outer membrane immunogenic protein
MVQRVFGTLGHLVRECFMRPLGIYNLGLALLASTMLVGAASAADIQRPAPVYKAPIMTPVRVYDWSGFYVGGNVGYGFGRQDTSLSGFGGLGSANVDGLIGGGQIGYNWQLNNLVLGVEADFQGSGQRGDGGVAGVANYTSKLDWFGTVRGRVGYAFDRWLPYVTGGYAYGHGDFSGTTGAGGFSTSNNYSGWAAGAGIEYAFLNNWSTKLEYLHVDFGNGPSAVTGAGTVGGNRLTDDIVRVGLNYKF